MIKIVSIRLRNFRVVKEGTFQPLQDGITGLSGANGAGKSSFLSGVLWALYGIRPESVPISGLRNQYASYEDECSVSVILEHDGQTIEIIRELKGKNNRTLLNIYVDGKEQTVTSVGTSEKWIVSRLKVDSKAFMTAFVIRQKELDSLVKAKPAERRVLIERLSGIEAMSVALKAAREGESNAKKDLQGLPGSQEELEMAYSLCDEQRSRVGNYQEEMQWATQELETRQKLSNQLSNQHNELLVLERAYQTRVTQVEELERQATQAQASLNTAKNLLTEHVREYPAIDMERISFLQQQQQDRQQELRVAEKALQAAHFTLNNMENTLEGLKAEVQNLESQKLTLAEESSELIASLENIVQRETELQTVGGEVTESENAMQLVTDDLIRLQETQRNLEESITKIKTLEQDKESTEQVTCPTCLSPLHDTHDLLASLEASLAPILPMVEKNSALLQEQRDRHRDLLSSIQTLRTEVARKEYLQNRQTKVTDSLEQIKVNLKTIQERIKVGTSKIASFSVTDEEKAVQTARESYERARTAWGEVEILQRANSTRERLESNFEQATKALEKVLEDLRLAEENLSVATKVVARDTESSKKLYTDALTATNEMATILNGAERNLLVAQERHNSFLKEVATQESYMSRRTAGLALLRAKTAVSDVLDEFRKNKIATIAPELSETATSLISTMTSGHYTEVILDEDFTPSVVDLEGIIRPVAWLSGGEESVVALALRMAIGDLMTGGEGGLLWLDEVLTAQDANRRSSLLEALRNISNKQIIMINHTQDAMDIVDKTVTVVREDNEGSVIAAEDKLDEVSVIPFSEEDMKLG